MISKSPDLTTEAAKSSPSVIAGPSVTFESVTFSDGTAINLEPNDIVVLVGPNNSGKSLALRELEHSVGPASEKMVVKAVSLRRIGTSEQVLELLSQHGRKIQDGGNWYYRGLRFSVSVSHIDRYWENQIDQLRSIFCMRIATETRITDSNQQGAISVLDQSPQHPIHLLYIDDRVERRISSYFRRAFGEDLIVFHAGGSQWPLLVGKRPVPPPGQDRVSVGYTVDASVARRWDA